MASSHATGGCSGWQAIVCASFSIMLAGAKPFVSCRSPSVIVEALCMRLPQLCMLCCVLPSEVIVRSNDAEARAAFPGACHVASGTPYRTSMPSTLRCCSVRPPTSWHAASACWCVETASSRSQQAPQVTTTTPYHKDCHHQYGHACRCQQVTKDRHNNADEGYYRLCDSLSTGVQGCTLVLTAVECSQYTETGETPRHARRSMAMTGHDIAGSCHTD